ncbi:protein phosphatase 2C domain-containing protein [Mycobacterium sp. 23]|uniref:protein phosphatase 2C domain-containing protein n=1 Tax=Mycobacterium sp. 23 TaxID=3400424 RepID=UPI003AAE509E
MADVVGPLHIPQITVGPPSHAAEPAPIGDDHRDYPFRPDLVADGWSTKALTVRGVSQRGHLHRYNGAPRQDDFAVHHISGGRLLVAVADGVSAAPQSHLGASAAVKQAIMWLRDNLDPEIGQTDWLGMMKNVAWSLAEYTQQLFRLAEPDPVRAEIELATTLVCGVIEPLAPGALRAHLVGIGDSGAWLMTSGAFTQLLGGKTSSDGGIASSAVTGLPRVPKGLVPVVADVGPGDVLLIATDGIGDPLGNGQGGVGNLFREVLSTSSPPSLIEFAHAVDFSREMFDDDRTLVAVWPRPFRTWSSYQGSPE